MIKNRDGSLIFAHDELFNGKNKILADFFPLTEHQFHVLLKNGDSKIECYAYSVSMIALGAFLQLVVSILCYLWANNHSDLYSLLEQIDKKQLFLLVLCVVLSGLLFFAGKFISSEKKQLISRIRSKFKEK